MSANRNRVRIRQFGRNDYRVQVSYKNNDTLIWETSFYYKTLKEAQEKLEDIIIYGLDGTTIEERELPI